MISVENALNKFSTGLNGAWGQGKIALIPLKVDNFGLEFEGREFAMDLISTIYAVI